MEFGFRFGFSTDCASRVLDVKGDRLGFSECMVCLGSVPRRVMSVSFPCPSNLSAVRAEVCAPGWGRPHPRKTSSTRIHGGNLRMIRFLGRECALRCLFPYGGQAAGGSRLLSFIVVLGFNLTRGPEFREDGT